MTRLTTYNQFNGRHYETGTIHNFYAYRGVTAPHTGQPISEPLLLGISGGIVFGYFAFAYENWDPFVALLTRNTFDPWDTLLSRLGAVQNVVRTAKVDKAEQNLLAALEDGTPAIVSADFFSFDYNAVETPGEWGVFPIVLYGLEGGEAYIADRAGVGLTSSAEQLQTARARVKKNKNQLITLEAPNFDKLPNAVTAGIWDTIKLFTEKPPKGSKNNFGFAAYQNWIKLLTKPTGKQSWDKVFPIGRKLHAGLASTYERIATFAQATGGAERHQYATFLKEAATILQRPALADVAPLFDDAAALWRDLETIVLPDTVAPLAETRQLLAERRDCFINEGNGSIERRRVINAQLAAIRDAADTDFPLNSAEVTQLKHQLADHIQQIHDQEFRAIDALRSAMTLRPQPCRG